MIANRHKNPKQSTPFRFGLTLRIEIGKRLRSEPPGTAAHSWRTEVVGITALAAEQLFEYLAAGLAAFGCLPTQQAIVLEQNGPSFFPCRLSDRLRFPLSAPAEQT
jgi:hypothetical protein